MKHLNEFAAFVKQGKHLVDPSTGLPLKALSLDAVNDNITVFFNSKQNIMFPAGKVLAYFHDEKWLPLYDEGKAGILMFNPMRGSLSQYGSSPISDIWKKSYNKRIENSEMIWSCIEGQITEGYLVIQMMSTRPGYKRNSINKKMLDAIKKDHKEPILWDEPTEDGMKFIKNYSGDDAKFYFAGKYGRPKNFLKLYPDGEERIIKFD
jgi:hypothetical protein